VFGSINLRQVPIRLREQFHALCALRGTSMTQRLIQLIELDIQRAYDTGEYQPKTELTFEEEVRLAGQGQLWPDGPVSGKPTGDS
jgi:hypothetical protein